MERMIEYEVKKRRSEEPNLRSLFIVRMVLGVVSDLLVVMRIAVIASVVKRDLVGSRKGHVFGG